MCVATSYDLLDSDPGMPGSFNARTSYYRINPVYLLLPRKKEFNLYYTPNLGFPIALPGREKEQGCFRGSTEGAKGPAREQ